MQAQPLERTIETRLNDAGVRYTATRRAVTQALAGASGPRSAAELHEDLRGAVPLSSLYRSLTVLEEAGVVQPHLGVKGMARFELAEWLSGHHHHFICVECGAVEDIEISPTDETALRGVIHDISRKAGRESAGHTLEIEGRCWRCR